MNTAIPLKLVFVLTWQASFLYEIGTHSLFWYSCISFRMHMPSQLGELGITVPCTFEFISERVHNVATSFFCSYATADIYGIGTHACAHKIYNICIIYVSYSGVLHLMFLLLQTFLLVWINTCDRKTKQKKQGKTKREIAKVSEVCIRSLKCSRSKCSVFVCYWSQTGIFYIFTYYVCQMCLTVY